MSYRLSVDVGGTLTDIVLFDDKIELHYNFCDKPEHDEPDGTSPEDRRVFPISVQSTLSSSVPPQKKGRLSPSFFCR